MGEFFNINYTVVLLHDTLSTEEQLSLWSKCFKNMLRMSFPAQIVKK